MVYIGSFLWDTGKTCTNDKKLNICRFILFKLIDLLKAIRESVALFGDLLIFRLIVFHCCDQKQSHCLFRKASTVQIIRSVSLCSLIIETVFGSQTYNTYLVFVMCSHKFFVKCVVNLLMITKQQTSFRFPFCSKHRKPL